MVSFTITEKGYNKNANGEYYGDVVSDFESEQNFPGALLENLQLVL